MSIELFKIMYQVCMIERDSEGYIVREIMTQDPLTLYGHQLDELSDQVGDVLAQAQKQTEEAE